MPWNPSWFVDRKRELALFQRMLAGETDERILLITVEGEQGKTWLLLWMFLGCEQQSIPVVLLDFDPRKGGLTDCFSVAREVRRHLGDDCTPAICACEDDIYRRAPLVNIHTGEGDAGVDFGQRGRFTEADISDVKGRDHIQIGSVSAGPPTPEQIAQQKEDMGRALRRDLANLAASHRRLVLLMDAFEQAPKDTCAWLNRWLFEPLRRDLGHVLLVVAGRPECRSFFDVSRLWSGLITAIDRFDPFSDDDIRNLCRQRKLSIREAEMPLLVDLARSKSPARIAELGDWLAQAREVRDE